MEKQGDNKFTWVLKDPSSLPPCMLCFSDKFVIGGCKWVLFAIPMPTSDAFCLYLDAYNLKSLPSGCGRYVKFRLTVVNQASEQLSLHQERLCLYYPAAQYPAVQYHASKFPLSKLLDKEGGFSVNGELKIVVEVDVLKVFGNLDIPNDVPKETTKTLSLIEENDGVKSSVLLKEASSVKEEIDVNGFPVLLSQVESVRCIFERHPEIAVEFRANNQILRKAFMNFLLSIIETLCQSVNELTNEDLVEADIALTYLKDAGFKVDWLEKKLDQVKANKEKEQFDLARLQEMKDCLLKLKQQCSDLDALVGKEESKLSATRTPLSFDDIV